MDTEISSVFTTRTLAELLPSVMKNIEIKMKAHKDWEALKDPIAIPKLFRYINHVKECIEASGSERLMHLMETLEREAFNMAYPDPYQRTIMMLEYNHAKETDRPDLD